MPFTFFGPHHVSLRKRIHNKLEPYPAPGLLKRSVDRLVYVVGIFIPIMTLPQVYEALIVRNPEGISAVSFFSYATANLVWFTYGMLHKEKPIIFGNATMFVLNGIIAISAVLY